MFVCLFVWNTHTHMRSTPTRVARYASKALRDDAEVVLEALRSDWRALRFASADLRADRRFLERAVRVDALALTFAAEGLRNDAELVALGAGPPRPGAGRGAAPPRGAAPVAPLGGGFLARRPPPRGRGA